MNTTFREDFPRLAQRASDTLPPTDEETGVTGWDNYAEDIAGIFGCNTDELRYLNSELLEGAIEQDEFTALLDWVNKNPMDLYCSANIDACIDGEFETLTIEAYFYKTDTKQPFFARVIEFQGDIQAFFFPAQFLIS